MMTFLRCKVTIIFSEGQLLTKLIRKLKSFYKHRANLTNIKMHTKHQRKLLLISKINLKLVNLSRKSKIYYSTISNANKNNLFKIDWSLKLISSLTGKPDLIVLQAKLILTLWHFMIFAMLCLTLMVFLLP